jgi:hypothetical protein
VELVLVRQVLFVTFSGTASRLLKFKKRIILALTGTALWPLRRIWEGWR